MTSTHVLVWKIPFIIIISSSSSSSSSSSMNENVANFRIRHSRLDINSFL